MHTGGTKQTQQVVYIFTYLLIVSNSQKETEDINLNENEDEENRCGFREEKEKGNDLLKFYLKLKNKKGGIDTLKGKGFKNHDI